MAERFGNFEILRRLAQGGMAEVLLAKQRSLGGFERLVCLKRILPHLSAQEDFLRMFQDEARIAANLVHPNIAQIYDIGEQEEHYYIAMEYVRGEDVRRIYNQEVARGQTIPRQMAALMVMGAAAGLDYAHRQTALDGSPLGIVHRDISPQNIVVTYDGHAKIVDFGVAKAAGKLNQTRSGVLKGKYSYMSPEQASGDPVDGRTDIFALGITLYETTTGVRLFKRENELETLHAVIACNVTPPSQIVPRYDKDFEAIVLRALAYDADHRYQTAGELEQDLERYLLGHGYPTSASHLAAYMQDLFAEKLADEALFGGPPWNEPATDSKAIPNAKSQANTRQPAAADQSDSSQEPASDAPTTDLQTISAEHTVADAEHAPDEQAQTAIDTDTQAQAADRTDEQQLPEPLQADPKTEEVPDISASDAAVQPEEAGDDWQTIVDEQESTNATRKPPEPLPEPAIKPTVTKAPPAAPEPDAQASSAPPDEPPKAIEAAVRSGTELVRDVPPPRWSLVHVAAAAIIAMLSVTLVYGLLRPAPPVADDDADPTAPVAEDASAQADAAAGSNRPKVPTGRALLSVRAPAPMEVLLGTESLGTTPLTDVVVLPGNLRLKLIHHADGAVVRRHIHLAPGARGSIRFSPVAGELTVDARPWAWVQYGEHPAEETPFKKALFEGDYTFILECPDGRRRNEMVHIEPGRDNRVTINCDGG